MSTSKYYRTLTQTLAPNVPLDLRGYPEATLYVPAAITTTTLEVSFDGTAWFPQALVKNTASEITTATSISEAGRYFLAKADCLVRVSVAGITVVAGQ